MPYAIELRFEPDAEEMIRGLWMETARFHGTGHLPDNGVIPHVALLAGDFRLEGIFRETGFPSETVRLSGTGFFGGGAVAWLRAEVSENVRTLQSLLYELALEAGAEIDPHYHPENWIPHCTIAQNCVTNRGRTLRGFILETRIKSGILVHYPPTVLVAERAAAPAGDSSFR